MTMQGDTGFFHQSGDKGRVHLKLVWFCIRNGERFDFDDPISTSTRKSGILCSCGSILYTRVPSHFVSSGQEAKSFSTSSEMKLKTVEVSMSCPRSIILEECYLLCLRHSSAFAFPSMYCQIVSTGHTNQSNTAYSNPSTHLHLSSPPTHWYLLPTPVQKRRPHGQHTWIRARSWTQKIHQWPKRAMRPPSWRSHFHLTLLRLRCFALQGSAPDLKILHVDKIKGIKMYYPQGRYIKSVNATLKL